MLLLIAVVILAYLIGSISFAIIFSKAFVKKDVREVGSGNAGATNVLRSVGVLPGILTFLCDALKGFVATFVGKIVFESVITQNPADWGIVGAYICGLACMVGHVLPIFFRFKGGKGVATSVGIFAVCSPIAIALGVAVFAILTVATRHVSLGSVIATFVVVINSMIFRVVPDAPLLPQLVLSVAMGVIVLFKHRTNIKRLINGTENKVGGKKNG